MWRLKIELSTWDVVLVDVKYLPRINRTAAEIRLAKTVRTVVPGLLDGFLRRPMLCSTIQWTYRLLVSAVMRGIGQCGSALRSVRRFRRCMTYIQTRKP